MAWTWISMPATRPIVQDHRFAGRRVGPRDPGLGAPGAPTTVARGSVLVTCPVRAGVRGRRATHGTRLPPKLYEYQISVLKRARSAMVEGDCAASRFDAELLRSTVRPDNRLAARDHCIGDTSRIFRNRLGRRNHLGRPIAPASVCSRGCCEVAVVGGALGVVCRRLQFLDQS